MKPRDLLLSRIEQGLRGPLEALGFRYARSKIIFSRKKGIVTQEIAFQLDRHNSENDCSFWTSWSTRAPAYSYWHEQQFGKPPANDVLGAAAEWNIPGWSRACHEHACLQNDARDEDVMQRLSDDVARAGVPYVDSISSWHGAAEYLVTENWFFAKTADFFMLAEDQERARAALLNGIRQYTVEGRFDQFGELPELKLRLAKFFPAAQPNTADPVAACTEQARSAVFDDFLMDVLGNDRNTVVFDPQKLVRELIAYGEPKAASDLMLLEAKQLQEIGRRAHEIWSDFSGEHGPMLDKAICLAVVEHIEGKSRELKRTRSEYPKKKA